MVDTSIVLIKPAERYRDEYGIMRDGESIRREILAQVESVGQREFFAGGEAGFRPEYRFTVFAAEYQGEDVCEYNGAVYAVYRTYHVQGTDYLELYVQRKGGVNNGE